MVLISVACFINLNYPNFTFYALKVNYVRYVESGYEYLFHHFYMNFSLSSSFILTAKKAKLFLR